MINFLIAATPFYKDPLTYVFAGLILLFGLMVFTQSRKRKTAQTEYAGMLDTLRPGMRVKTVGGVIGRIKEIREEAPSFKTILLETGTDKNPSLVLYDIQAIYGVVNDEKIAQINAGENSAIIASSENSTASNFSVNETKAKQGKPKSKSQ